MTFNSNSINTEEVKQCQELKHYSGFNDNYDLGNLLGSGAFSDVVEGTNKHEQTEYAIKIIYKDNIENDNEIHEEINILHSLNHEHIVNFYSVYNDPDAYYIVTELLRGGELYERLESKEGFAYVEKDAKHVCKCILKAINYCHDVHNIVHRDIKPENILLVHEHNDTTVKIIDFGFAKRLENSRYLKTQCGTMDYTAPEVLKGLKYGKKVDVWSIGIILYLLLVGYEPFSVGTMIRRKQKIISGNYIFEKDDWFDISLDAQILIRCLLNVRVNKRYNANDALDHIWFTNDNDVVVIDDDDASKERSIRINNQSSRA